MLELVIWYLPLSTTDNMQQGNTTPHTKSRQDTLRHPPFTPAPALALPKVHTAVVVWRKSLPYRTNGGRVVLDECRPRSCQITTKTMPFLTVCVLVLYACAYYINHGFSWSFHRIWAGSRTTCSANEQLCLELCCFSGVVKMRPSASPLIMLSCVSSLSMHHCQRDIYFSIWGVPKNLRKSDSRKLFFTSWNPFCMEIFGALFRGGGGATATNRGPFFAKGLFRRKRQHTLR